jgi:hypothetical protein
MLNIIAESLMIAIRADSIWLRDARPLDDKRPQDRYFWKGRPWRRGSLNEH